MVTFNPNWNSKSEKHHLVPKTYLNAWAYKDSSVYYIEKHSHQTNLKNQDISRNTKRLFRIKDFYSRRAGALSSSKDDCDKYFAPLKDKKLIVTMDGAPVSDTSLLNKKFSSYEKWIITDQQNIILNEAEKQKLKDEIREIHIRDIEEGWNRIYENNWPTVRSAIIKEIADNQGANKIMSQYRDLLIGFMVSIDWRTQPSHPILEEKFNKVILSSGFSEQFDEVIPDNERVYPFIDTGKEEFKHNYLLKYYWQFLNKKGVIYNEFKFLDNKTNVELMIPENGYEFITSDNPVTRFLNHNNETEYIFPITPTLLCAIRKSAKVDKNHYFVNTISKEKVYKYNDQLKKNSNRGFILHQPLLGVYFK